MQVICINADRSFRNIGQVFFKNGLIGGDADLLRFSPVQYSGMAHELT